MAAATSSHPALPPITAAGFGYSQVPPGRGSWRSSRCCGDGQTFSSQQWCCGTRTGTGSSRCCSKEVDGICQHCNTVTCPLSGYRSNSVPSLSTCQCCSQEASGKLKQLKGWWDPGRGAGGSSMHSAWLQQRSQRLQRIHSIPFHGDSSAGTAPGSLSPGA